MMRNKFKNLFLSLNTYNLKRITKRLRKGKMSNKNNNKGRRKNRRVLDQDSIHFKTKAKREVEVNQLKMLRMCNLLEKITNKSNLKHSLIKRNRNLKMILRIITMKRRKFNKRKKRKNRLKRKRIITWMKILMNHKIILHKKNKSIKSKVRLKYQNKMMILKLVMVKINLKRKVKFR